METKPTPPSWPEKEDTDVNPAPGVPQNEWEEDVPTNPDIRMEKASIVQETENSVIREVEVDAEDWVESVDAVPLDTAISEAQTGIILSFGDDAAAQRWIDANRVVMRELPARDIVLEKMVRSFVALLWKKEGTKGTLLRGRAKLAALATPEAKSALAGIRSYVEKALLAPAGTGHSEFLQTLSLKQEIYSAERELEALKAQHPDAPEIDWLTKKIAAAKERLAALQDEIPTIDVEADDEKAA